MPNSVSRWPWWRRWFGNRSERAAERFLKRKGFRILQRNYLCPGGELDIIALDGWCLVFAEVRSTAGTDRVGRAESITPEKHRRMTRAALHFLARHRLRNQDWRFDVLILSWPPEKREPLIDHYAAAFEPVGRFQLDS
jgi:putative endonuclease